MNAVFEKVLKAFYMLVIVLVVFLGVLLIVQAA